MSSAAMSLVSASWRSSSTGAPTAWRARARASSSAISPMATPCAALTACASGAASAPSVTTRRTASAAASRPSVRRRASAGVMMPSSAKSSAMRARAWAVRLPARVCSSHRRPFSSVNSKSCMSPKAASSCCVACSSSCHTAGAAAASASWPRALRRPETTSSPCALNRKSTQGAGSPVEGWRVKPTPAPEVPPALPNTMRCTVTAVPMSSDRPLSRRYSRALGACQLPNTAAMARSSCSCGDCGKGRPDARSTLARWARVRARSSAKSSSRSSRPAAICARSASNTSDAMPSTTSP